MRRPTLASAAFALTPRQRARLRPIVDDPPGLHHHDAVEILERGELVRDRNHCAPAHQVVERRGGLVQQQDRRVLQQRTGDREPLSLPGSPTMVWKPSGAVAVTLAMIGSRNDTLLCAIQ
jgi:hypothetical protein